MKHVLSNAAHAGVLIVVLLVCLAVPSVRYRFPSSLYQGADAVTGASLVVPDQPSGTFFVYLNAEKHPGTAAEWEAFFTEQPVGVIMEDLACLVPAGDAAGQELAERYRARLAENQMTVTKEDGTLIVSKAETGHFDVIVVSAEADAAYDYSRVKEEKQVIVIPVKGDAS